MTVSSWEGFKLVYSSSMSEGNSFTANDEVRLREQEGKCPYCNLPLRIDNLRRCRPSDHKSCYSDLYLLHPHCYVKYRKTRARYATSATPFKAFNKIKPRRPQRNKMKSFSPRKSSLISD